MKRSTYHIIYSWALLVCFVTGQYMVYAHQHNIVKKAHFHALQNDNNSSKQVLTEKCPLCDSMHHTHMELTHNNTYYTSNSINHTYITVTYDFKSIALILASGRAPPVIS
ncbi:hypothetical protein FFF34_013675 [Inquilinus sp. KBS0705]|nr:hypothetical protein FFF34_013675 [Inquilinus sp. KBS0705]